MKINPRSKSSGQILVIVIIVLVLLGIAYWWLDSNKRQMAQEGRQFGRQVIQELIMQRNMKFFVDHLSPAMRLQYPPSAQQDLMTQLEKLGTPISPPNVEGDIVFQSHFFEPNGVFHAHINYPTRGADINVAVSHPVGRWQIDEIGLTAEQAR
jgi:type II secretory pathway pseudopilin PulG